MEAKDPKSVCPFFCILSVKPGVETNVEVDGCNGQIFKKKFALVIVFKFLFRPLLYRLENLLNSNGVLIYETFMEGQEKIGRPKRSEFLLKTNELKVIQSDQMKS